MDVQAQNDPVLQECKDYCWRMLLLEPSARRVLSRGMPPLDSGLSVCEVHTQTILDGRLPVNQSALHDRHLMPMCNGCAVERLQELAITLPAQSPVHVDTCVCAANILDGKWCAWCHLKFKREALTTYMQEHAHELTQPDSNSKKRTVVLCHCGRLPSSPKNEILRFCPGCTGVVSVPMHSLDGSAHLLPATHSTSIRWAADRVPSAEWTEHQRKCREEHPVKPCAWILAVLEQEEAQAAKEGLRAEPCREEVMQDTPMECMS
ncbi:Hypothetical predicted protein [Lecanosticta acicola]|uniref:Uncharacterized protein n=1 Tax=Lecanosticta acicola TaxID=111012 RepID=A0AAI9EDQ4_9PEZI|nr:Hypothetical predicted protein [Lecanosticta acicola]